MKVRRIVATLIATLALSGTAAPAFASHGADDVCGAGQVCDPAGHH